MRLLFRNRKTKHALDLVFGDIATTTKIRMANKYVHYVYCSIHEEKIIHSKPKRQRRLGVGATLTRNLLGYSQNRQQLYQLNVLTRFAVIRANTITKMRRAPELFRKLFAGRSGHKLMDDFGTSAETSGNLRRTYQLQRIRASASITLQCNIYHVCSLSFSSFMYLFRSAST